MVGFQVRELIYSFSDLIFFVMGLVSVVIANVATYGAQRVLDVISSICLRLSHHFVGRLLGDTRVIPRSVQSGGDTEVLPWSVQSGRWAGAVVGGYGAADTRTLVDLEAQVRVGDSLDVASGGVSGSSGDLSMDVIAVE